MKVYIRKYKQEPISINFFTADIGFRELGFEVVYYEDVRDIKGNNPEDIIVGGIGDVRYVLDQLGKKYPTLEYPEKIFKREYLGRRIWIDTLGSIMNDERKWNVFIKPVAGGKLFTGTVIKDIRDFRACSGVSQDSLVWCSELINFVSEYRCFIRYGEIIGVKHYKGDGFVSPDKKVLQAMINDYEDSPNAYAIDLGITDKGETYLVEINEGYSVGAYGLDAVKYAKILATRWAELTNTEDLLKWY